MPSLNAGIRTTHTAADEWEIPSPPPLQQFGRKTTVESSSNGPSAT